MEGAIPSNSYTNNIDEFIQENEEMLLSIYDIDISGEKLTEEQKIYITNLYIIQNKGRYIENITEDKESSFKIDINIWKDVYSYLFLENNSAFMDEYIKIDLVNKEKFHIDSRKIVKYSCINDTHVLEIEYISKFLDKEYKYNVKYNIGCKDGKYYIIGFVIN